MKGIDSKGLMKIALALSGCLAVLNEQDDPSRHAYRDQMYIYPLFSGDIVIYIYEGPDIGSLFKVCLLDEDRICWIRKPDVEGYLDFVTRGDMDDAIRFLSFSDDYPIVA